MCTHSTRTRTRMHTRGARGERHGRAEAEGWSLRPPEAVVAAGRWFREQREAPGGS